ncbi:hypothetical protein E1301_Tti006272 [Triplophysa tibetana]|uniref:Uncharacterized protein n=1 Tax=Triplophysa tibetana TaxID=1572043 RepID=A0A5A9NT69_9TELE|nr:hypothetical protein E1301_Tti006272 [Triplophysa tibetana]
MQAGIHGNTGMWGAGADKSREPSQRHTAKTASKQEVISTLDGVYGTIGQEVLREREKDDWTLTDKNENGTWRQKRRLEEPKSSSVADHLRLGLKKLLC